MGSWYPCVSRGMSKLPPPKRVFTHEEYMEDSQPAHKAAGLYSGVTILNEDGERSLSISLGTPDRTCHVCKELPDWCSGTPACQESWKDRAVASEDQVRAIQSKLEDIVWGL